jgi:hypothetical protein
LGMSLVTSWLMATGKGKSAPRVGLFGSWRVSLGWLRLINLRSSWAGRASGGGGRLFGVVVGSTEFPRVSSARLVWSTAPFVELLSAKEFCPGRRRILAATNDLCGGGGGLLSATVGATVRSTIQPTTHPDGGTAGQKSQCRPSTGHRPLGAVGRSRHVLVCVPTRFNWYARHVPINAASGRGWLDSRGA